MTPTEIKQQFTQRFNGSLSLIEPFFAPADNVYGYSTPALTTVFGAPRYVVHIDADRIAAQTERFADITVIAYIDAICFCIKLAVSGIAARHTPAEASYDFALEVMSQQFHTVYQALNAGHMLVLDLAI